MCHPVIQCCCTILLWFSRSLQHLYWKTRKATWKRCYLLWETWNLHTGNFSSVCFKVCYKLTLFADGIQDSRHCWLILLLAWLVSISVCGGNYFHSFWQNSVKLDTAWSMVCRTICPWHMLTMMAPSRDISHLQWQFYCKLCST